MTKIDDLRALEEEIIKDKSLPLQESNLVFGEGNPDAEVMFIGEAPGFYEDKLKRPFVGRSGKLLDKLIEEIGWKREDVYITNIVKRRPPENRDPLPEEIEAYKPYLSKQIRVIDPKIIAPLGRFSMNYFLPNAKISKDQGRIFWMRDKIVMPIYHPAAALRSGSVLIAIKESFAKLKKVVEKYDELLEAKKKRAQDEPVEETTDQKEHRSQKLL